MNEAIKEPIITPPYTFKCIACISFALALLDMHEAHECERRSITQQVADRSELLDATLKTRIVQLREALVVIMSEYDKRASKQNLNITKQYYTHLQQWLKAAIEKEDNINIIPVLLATEVLGAVFPYMATSMLNYSAIDTFCFAEVYDALNEHVEVEKGSCRILSRIAHDIVKTLIDSKMVIRKRVSKTRQKKRAKRTK